MASLKYDASNSLQLVELLYKLPSVESKKLVVDFLNRHSDLVRTMNTPGTTENVRHLAAEPCFRADETLINIVRRLPEYDLEPHLTEIDRFLSRHANVSAVYKALGMQDSQLSALKLLADAGENIPAGMSVEKSDAFLNQFAEAVDSSYNRTPKARAVMTEFGVPSDWFYKRLNSDPTFSRGTLQRGFMDDQWMRMP